MINSTSEVDINGNLIVGGDLIVKAQTIDQNRTMARSTAGADGTIALAIAVSVENGNTNAYLDGSAAVAGNVTVDAQQSKGPVERARLYILPGKANGVVALAGTVSSTGNLIDDTQKKAVDAVFGKLIGKVSNWFSKKWTDTFGSSDAVWDFDVAAGFNVVVDNNNVTARIGDGSSAADVTAGGDVNVNALIKNRPNITARTVAKDENAGDKTNQKKRTTTGIGVAIAVGIYNNTAKAHISGNTQVDAKGLLQVTADVENKIEWQKLWGVNIGFAIAAFFNGGGSATYTTESGTQRVNRDNTVDIRNGFTGQGDVGTRYKSRVNRGMIDLSTENFKDNTLWDVVGNTTRDAALNLSRTLTTYLDGNLGLDANLIDSWGTSTSLGQKKAKAGAVNVIVLNHTSEALIKSGASINQRLDDYTTNTTGTTTVAQGETVKVLSGHNSSRGKIGRIYEAKSTQNDLNLADGSVNFQ